MLAIVFWPARDLYYRIGRVWFDGLLAIFGAKVEWRGTDALDPARDYVILANHRSQLDPVAIAVAVYPKVTRWVAKKELRRVPILGPALAMSGQIFIDRGDTDAARASLARHVGDRGVFVCFFPEGHRSSTRRLLPFKKGGAAFAIAAGLPVVPVAISGSESCLPNHSIVSRPGTIRVCFGEPIDTANLDDDERGSLTSEVRQRIENMLHDMEGPPPPSARAADAKGSR